MRRSLTEGTRTRSARNTFSDSILSRVTKRDWEKDEDIQHPDAELDSKVLHALPQGPGALLCSACETAQAHVLTSHTSLGYW